MFSANPIWKSNEMDRTAGVSWADIDGDGDLDVIFGNQQDRNVGHYGKKNPPYTGNPLAPTNQLVNTNPHFTSVRIGNAANNLRTVVFNSVDVESDPFLLLMEYQFRGEVAWRRADLSGSNATDLYSALPAGVTDSVVWDISLVPFDSRDVVVRMKAIENPVHVSDIRSIHSFQSFVGQVLPIRSEISTPAKALVFETVTVGDTVSAGLIVSNTGTSDLTILDVLLPSTEMTIDVVPPFDIAVGELAEAIGIGQEARRDVFQSHAVQS